METTELEIKTRIQIAKPVSDVFEAIIYPEKMRHYFIAESSGIMEAGKKLTWKFPEFDMEVPVSVQEIIANQQVSYQWDIGERQTVVLIALKEAGDNATLLTITEGSMPNDEAGIKWLKSNTEGWANFLACMKAYLEYGINLRKGAFDFMKTTANP
ncbi:MAG: ATPase [Ferruginibacter sp.]|nr:ATPase [Ferruginibacter sp.]